jgi:toxin-antitoxin system PIN domain toxin
MYLPDVNVWLAITFESHVHHAAAKNWYDSLSEEACAFCRMTQQGFLRLATNPKAFESEAVSLTDAWQFYDTFLRDPLVRFRDEPEDVERL